jgi:hypothetical protein
MGHRDEIAVGALSACTCFGSLYETVVPFQKTNVDEATGPIEDIFPMMFDGPLGLNDKLQSAVCCPEVPALQEGFPGLTAGLFPGQDPR